MTGLNPSHNASWLIYGETKTGKSTLAATAPGRKLVLDAEGSWNAFEEQEDPNRPGEPYRIEYWDDLSKPPPEGDWDICIVNVLRWETIDHAMRWVEQPNHPFQSIVMDSVTEVQRRCKKFVTNTDAALEYKDWGQLLNQMSTRIQRFRDIIKLDRRNPARCMVFTAEGKDRSGKYVPQMEGQLRDSIAYWMNTTACLRVVKAANSDGIVTDDSPITRRLLVKPHPMYITGTHYEHRFDRNAINDPNITQMMSTIFPGFEAGDE